MNILFLNNADVEGGSGRAANRLLTGLRNNNVDVHLLVARKFSDNAQVIGPASSFGKAMGFARPTLEQTMFGISPRTIHGPFSPAFIPDRLPGRVARLSPDIIHLHWVANMMRLETLPRFGKPLVWTLHDSWPFTGGCYVPFDCTRYRDSCGQCPVLGSTRDKDLSHRIWLRKQRAWQGLNLTLVAPSRWMAASAQASSLFRDSRIEVIPNAIDVERFRSIDKASARNILSLPHDKKLILFGAKAATTDRNKGFHLLTPALHALAGRIEKESAELIVFGSAEARQPAELPFKAHYLGWLNDEISLALLYAAADVFVFPSIQESLGYTVMEAMACGTPCVAFNQGGVPDLIDHEHNGYLAKTFEPADLARGIAWILEDDGRRSELAARARQKVVQEFALDKVAERHVALYREILNHE